MTQILRMNTDKMHNLDSGFGTRDSEFGIRNSGEHEKPKIQKPKQQNHTFAITKNQNHITPYPTPHITALSKNFQLSTFNSLP